MTLEELIDALKDHKIIKNFNAQFGNAAGLVNITTITHEELKSLTIALYEEVIFIGHNYANIYNDEEKYNYYNHFHAVFNQLKLVCQEINNRNGLAPRTIVLPIERIMFTQKILDEINLVANNNHDPNDVLSQLEQRCVEANGKNLMRDHIEQQKNTLESRLKYLNKDLAEKWIKKLCFEIATEAGLKFYRAAGTDEALEKQAKNLATAFLNKKRPWYKQYFNGYFRSPEEKLYDSLKSSLKEKVKSGTVLNRGSKDLYEIQITNAFTRALFSLKGTATYDKIIRDQALYAWEKVVWQRRLIKHLQYSLNGVNPFLSYAERTAETLAKNSTFARTAFLFIIGIVFCPILAPITKEYFKETFVAPLFNGLHYITKPIRWVAEKAIVVPIEAPFKFLSAVSEATFQGGNFDPNSSWFGRIWSACKAKTFLSSTFFHEKYDYAAETHSVNRMLNNIAADVRNNRVDKPVIQNIPQKPMQKTPIKFAAKVMAEIPGKNAGNETTVYNNINPGF